jgi:glutaminase
VKIDYQNILEEIYAETRGLLGQGLVADYIPALASVYSGQYGIAVQTLAGESFQVGAAEVPFSIQSISKVFVLTRVYAALGEALWQRMGNEPSGTAFNSLILLETENGIPRNPFINAGALVATDCFIKLHTDPLTELLAFVRQISNNPNIDFDRQVANSERDSGYRNAALVNLMKSFGNIENDVESVLDVYYHQCSLMMSSTDLARAFLYLSNSGINPWDGERLLMSSQAKRLNAIMQTCGLYNESGEFAYSVGLPGKSGVGGGIVAIIPNLLSVCVWSPELNQHGNSLAGMKALELFTTKTGISIF